MRGAGHLLEFLCGIILWEHNVSCLDPRNGSFWYPSVKTLAGHDDEHSSQIWSTLAICRLALFERKTHYRCIGGGQRSVFALKSSARRADRNYLLRGLFHTFIAQELRPSFLVFERAELLVERTGMGGEIS